MFSCDGFELLAIEGPTQKNLFTSNFIENLDQF
jgi:hypothetical protein